MPFLPTTSAQAKLRAWLLLLAFNVISYVTVGMIDSKGGTMFLLIPVTTGSAIGLLSYRHRLLVKDERSGWLQRALRQWFWLGPILAIVTALILVAIKAEGVACVLILMSFLILFQLPGYFAGRFFARWMHKKVPLPGLPTTLTFLFLVNVLSAFIGLKLHDPAQDPNREMSSSVVVLASAEEVYEALSRGRSYSGKASAIVEGYHMPKPSRVVETTDPDIWEIHGGDAIVRAKITRRIKNAELAFDYLSVERLAVASWPKAERFDKWLSLKSGAFLIEELDDDGLSDDGLSDDGMSEGHLGERRLKKKRCRLTRVTSYRWHLRPAWAFLPFELLIGEGVHQFALERIAEEAVGKPIIVDSLLGGGLAKIR